MQQDTTVRSDVALAQEVSLVRKNFFRPHQPLRPPRGEHAHIRGVAHVWCGVTVWFQRVWPLGTQTLVTAARLKSPHGQV
jgi:hypothetical protein